MDKARSRDFVERLPASVKDELLYKEQVHDRQILLNEEWHEYAVRTRKPTSRVDEEHVKWITETWEEYEARKRAQRQTLAHYDAEAEMHLRTKESQAARTRERSDQVIAHLMKFRHDAMATQTPSRHHLYADFDEYQRIKFARERQVIMTAEALIREHIETWQQALDAILCEAARCNRQCMATLQSEREGREEAQRKREEEERQRAREEEQRREQERKRLKEEEAQRRKEQAELEKRLERKRREEERRAKARADRERQKELETAQNADVAEVPAELDECHQNSAPPEEDASVEVDGTPHRINFEPLEADNIVLLFKNATRILSSGGDNCYIMAVRKNPCASSVICQNGFFVGEDSSAAPLLGKHIDTATCISVSSEKLHSALEHADSEEKYGEFHVEHVTNVQQNDACELFRTEATKEAETLLLFPIFSHGVPYSPYVLGLCRAGVDSIAQLEIQQAAALAYSLCKKIAALQRQAFLHQLCQQCVEWINVSTGCEDVYISLRSSAEANSLTYVAATESHRFMLGKRHSRSEEESQSGGISFTAMDQSIIEKQVRVSAIADVSHPEQNIFAGKSARFFTEGDKKGPLLVAPITGVRNGDAESVGVVFLDRIGSKKTFSAIDVEITRAATQLLADIILGNQAIPSLKLKIEDDVGDGPAPITFLKVLWHKSCEELDQITPNQLLELAKYLHPPPVIPVVVQSTLLIALGCKPKTIEDWDEARKRVTRKLLDKMLTFDPTNTKARKRAFFVCSRKLLKGMTAEAVFEKGSYPTQCFFKWTFTALLLRKHAESIQKQLRDGRSGEADVVSLFSNSTVGVDSVEEDDDCDDTVDDNVEEA